MTPPKSDDDFQHLVDHTVGIGVADDIDMKIALSEMTEEVRLALEFEAPHRAGEVVDPFERDRHIELDRYTQTIDRLGYRLPVRPKPRIHHRFRVLGDRRGDPGFDEHIEGCLTREWPDQATMLDHRIEAGTVEELDRTHIWDPESERLTQRLHRDKGHHRLHCFRRQEPHPRRRYHTESPLAPDHELKGIRAEAGLGHPLESGKTASIGQHGLQPQHLTTGVALGHDMAAPGVAGDGSADGGRVTRGEVYPIAKPRLTGMLLQSADRDPRPHSHRPQYGIDRSDSVESSQ